MPLRLIQLRSADGQRLLAASEGDGGAYLVECGYRIQAAMRKEHVSFAVQNHFLTKLAPIKRDSVER